MEQLVNLLTADFPYRKFGTLNPFGTTAIFSRLPMEDIRVLDLQADRSALGVRVHRHGRSIFFISAHLRAFGWPQILYFLKNGSYATALSAARQFRIEQNQQARILLNAITERQDDSVILACDCNTKDLMSTYGLLSSQLQVASPVIGLQPWFSMPSDQYLDINPQHVDHIFYSGMATPVVVYKLKANAGSDHTPLIVDFSLVDAGNKRKSQ